MVWTATTDGSNATHGEVVNYAQLFPAEWVDRHSARTLWIDAYRVPFLPGPDTPNPPRSVDLGDVCATFVRSILLYQSVRPPAVDLATPETLSEIELHPPQMQIPLIMDDWVPRAPEQPSPSETFGTKEASVPPGSAILVVHNVQVVNHKTNLGTFVLLATPYHREGQAGNEEDAKERLRTAAGLLGAVMGKNAVYEPVFSFQIDSAGNPESVGSVVFENPASFRTPNLSNAGLTLLESFAARISALPSTLRDRARSSLRWLYQAMSENDGMFSFLKYWIAIETLAMPDGTNIKPVIRQLALAYNQSEAQARGRFAIGRLFDLRSQVVHHGSTLIVGQDLLAYIEGVYIDLLVQALGEPSGHIAEAIMQRSGHTALELTQSATPVARRRLQISSRATGNAGVTVVDNQIARNTPPTSSN